MREIVYKSKDFDISYIIRSNKKYLIFLDYNLLINRNDNSFYKDNLINEIHILNYIITDLNLNIKCVKTFVFNNEESNSERKSEIREVATDIEGAYFTICRNDEKDKLLSNLKIAFTKPNSVSFFDIEDRVINKQDRFSATKSIVKTEVADAYAFVKKNKYLQKAIGEKNSGGVFFSETPFNYISILKNSILDEHIHEYLRPKREQEQLDDIPLCDILEMFDDNDDS